MRTVLKGVSKFRHCLTLNTLNAIIFRQLVNTYKSIKNKYKYFSSSLLHPTSKLQLRLFEIKYNYGKSILGMDQLFVLAFKFDKSLNSKLTKDKQICICIIILTLQYTTRIHKLYYDTVLFTVTFYMLVVKCDPYNFFYAWGFF